MGIKLRTAVDKHGGLVTRPHEGIVDYRCNIQHDAAVAHALGRAVNELAAAEEGYGQPTADSFFKRAAEILRDDFGIKE